MAARAQRNRPAAYRRGDCIAAAVESRSRRPPAQAMPPRPAAARARARCPGRCVGRSIAQVLPRLGGLVEQAPRAPCGSGRSLAAGCAPRNPASHPCPAAPRPPRQRPCATTAPCPTSTAPKRRDDRRGAGGVAPHRRSVTCPQARRGRAQAGRSLGGPDDGEARLLEDPDHRAQGGIVARLHAPPAAAAQAARWRGRTERGSRRGRCTAPAKITCVTPSRVQVRRRKGTSRSTRKVRSGDQPFGQRSRPGERSAGPSSAAATKPRAARPARR